MAFGVSRFQHVACTMSNHFVWGEGWCVCVWCVILSRYLYPWWPRDGRHTNASVTHIMVSIFNQAECVPFGLVLMQAMKHTRYGICRRFQYCTIGKINILQGVSGVVITWSKSKLVTSTYYNLDALASGVLSIVILGTTFNGIWITKQEFSSTKVHFKMTSAR